MPTDRELMQQALDALDYEADRGNDDAYRPLRKALRARLAQPEQPDWSKAGFGKPQPEPYAAQAAMIDQQTQGRMYVDPLTGDVGIGTVKPEQEPRVKWDASASLVVHPHPAFQATQQQREWQGLTENEKEIIWDEAVDGREHFCSQYGNFADAIEAKLKEKNA